MKISCQACSTKYSIPDEKVQGEGRTFKIRCKNCGEMMTVKGIGEGEAAGAADDQWYYAVGSDRKGPVTSADIAGLVAAGTINSDTYVWQQGMEAWTHLKDVAPLAGALGASAAAAAAAPPEEDTAYMSKDAIMAAHQDYTAGAEEDPDGATVAMDKPDESLFAAAEASAASDFGEALSTAGSEDTSSSPFGDSSGGSDDGSDDMFSFDNVEDATESPAGVHGRRDSSVLFSLDELANPDERAGMSQEEAILTETSGLIDIRAVANREKSGSGDDPFGAAGTGGLAVPGAAGGFAPVSVPIVAAKKSKAPMLIGIAVLLVVIIGGAVGFFMWQDSKAESEKVAAAEKAALEKASAAKIAAAKAETEKLAAEKIAAAKLAAAEKLGAEKLAAAKLAAAAQLAAAKTAAPAAVPAAPAAGTVPAAGTAGTEPTTPTPSSGGSTAKKKKKKPAGGSSSSASSPAPTPKPSPKPKPSSSSNNKKANDLLSALNKPKAKPSGGGDSGGGGTLKARLSSAQVKSKLSSKKSKFRACLKLMSPPPAGSVTVRTRIVIKSSGRVGSANVSSSGGTSGAVQSCVIRAIKGINFGSFGDPSMTVNYPVRLQ